MSKLPLPEAVSSLVERARLGDQNAMGMLSMVKQSADKGDAKAKKTLTLTMSDIEKHPSMRTGTSNFRTAQTGKFYAALRTLKQPDHAVFAGEVTKLAPRMNDVSVVAVLLADGPMFSTARLQAIAKTQGGPKEQKLFAYCVMSISPRAVNYLAKKLPPEKTPIIKLGRSVGLARQLQGIRSRRLPFSAMSPMMGWELGE